MSVLPIGIAPQFSSPHSLRNPVYPQLGLRIIRVQIQIFAEYISYRGKQ